MSTYQKFNRADDEPRFAPWLAVMACSPFSALLALFVPAVLFVPLTAATVLLFVASLVMLRADTRRRRRDGEER